MHFANADNKAEADKREEHWYGIHFKKDFIDILKRYGRLPEASLQAYLDEMSKDTWNPNIQVEWQKWHKSRGLIACANKDTIDLIVRLVNQISFDGKRFRAWKREEYGFSNIVSVFLPTGTALIKEDDTINLLRKQNRLTVGELSNPKFKSLTMNGCRILTFAACSTLAAKIHELPNGSCYLGFNKVKILTKLRTEHKNINYSEDTYIHKA